MPGVLKRYVGTKALRGSHQLHRNILLNFDNFASFLGNCEWNRPVFVSYMSLSGNMVTNHTRNKLKKENCLLSRKKYQKSSVFLTWCYPRNVVYAKSMENASHKIDKTVNFDGQQVHFNASSSSKISLWYLPWKVSVKFWDFTLVWLRIAYKWKCNRFERICYIPRVCLWL